MPARQCLAMRLEVDSSHSLTMNVIHRATHVFDVEGFDEDVGRRRIRYDAEATADAAKQMKSFLAEHLQ